MRKALRLAELVKEEPGVLVREYNFAAAASSHNAGVNRFRWARSFPALWGLRNEPQMRVLIDAGQPFIKPAAALLDCARRQPFVGSALIEH